MKPENYPVIKAMNANFVYMASQKKCIHLTFSGAIALAKTGDANQNTETSHPIYNLYDPRIKAAILLAPLGVLFKDKKSLSKVKAPIRIYRAEEDEVLRYPYHAESIRQKLTIIPEYTIVKNSGHYSFLSPFPNSIKNEIGVPAKDPEGFDRIQFHKKMNEEIVVFLSKSLR